MCEKRPESYESKKKVSELLKEKEFSGKQITLGRGAVQGVQAPRKKKKEMPSVKKQKKKKIKQKKKKKRRKKRTAGKSL